MNFHDDNDLSEPFSVDIFCDNRRFSPALWVQTWQGLCRWAIYLFIPFCMCAILVALAVYVIIFPIETPLDTTNVLNIAAVIFFGIVLPGVLLIMWYRSIPWWFLNGTDRCWQIRRMIAEDNGHRFPEDFWHPFMHNELGAEENVFADELRIDSETDIDGFVGADIFLHYGTNFYFENAYWKLEPYGLRFYGDRMNIFIPYWAIQIVQKNLLCAINLKLDTSTTGQWTEILIWIEQFATMRDDRRLRNALHQRIISNKRAAYR